MNNTLWGRTKWLRWGAGLLITVALSGTRVAIENKQQVEQNGELNTNVQGTDNDVTQNSENNIGVQGTNNGVAIGKLEVGEVPRPPRQLEVADGGKIKKAIDELLEGYSQKTVQVTFISNDEEAFDFSEQIKKHLESRGYMVVHNILFAGSIPKPFSIGYGAPVGQYQQIKGQDAPVDQDTLNFYVGKNI